MNKVKKAYTFHKDTFLKSIALRLTTLQRCGVDIISECFDFYRGGPGFDFDIYHIKAKLLPKGYAAGTIELAVLRKMPKAHSHHLPGCSWFFFLDDNCALEMGGARNEQSSVLTYLKMQSGVFYPIPPFVFHAAGPSDDSKETRLLIFNPQGLRPRPEGSNYAVDTFEAKRTVLWSEVHQGSEQKTSRYFVPPAHTSGFARTGIVAAMALLLALLIVSPAFHTEQQTQSASATSVEVAYNDFLRDCDMWLVRRAQATGDTSYLAKVGTSESATAVYGSEF